MSDISKILPIYRVLNQRRCRLWAQTSVQNNRTKSIGMKNRW